MTNEFNKFSGCEINTQKSIAFLHTTMNVRKSKSKGDTIYNHTQKNEIYSVINLIKCV